MNRPTSCRKRIRNTAISIITFSLGLGLIASSHAQSYRSKADQKEVNTMQTTATQDSKVSSVDKDAIRPFHVNIPEEQLVDLRRRVAATKWPEKETVGDYSQGVPLATMK